MTQYLNGSHLKPHTGRFHWSLADVIEEANRWTKTTGIYYTGIKGPPRHHLRQNDCWAITNRYDPRAKDRRVND